MPENRPKRMVVYMEGDEEHFHEVAKLERAVVVEYHQSINFTLSIDKISELVTQSGVVEDKEITISKLSNTSFIINLSEGLAAKTFVDAIPTAVWDMGFSFRLWSQRGNASPKVPAYRVLVQLHDLPPHLYREQGAIRAVSTFGLYMGTVAQANQEDLSYWTVAVGVRELEDVPLEVELVVGGMEHVVQVVPVRWVKGNIYDKLPKASERFERPPSPTSSPKPPQVHESETSDGDEFISVSRNFLFEICKDLNIDQIPEELRKILRGETTGLRDIRPLHDLIEQVPVMAVVQNKERIPHQQQ